MNAHMYRQESLDKKILVNSCDVLVKALQGNQFLTRNELAAALTSAGIPAKSVRLAYVLMYAELEAVICSGPRRGKQFTYALLAERASEAKLLGPDAALAELCERYFASHGPATLQDFTWWSGLTIADAKSGVEIAGAG
jgi:hypothetical protein